jgi:hypothetical protein
MATRVQQRTSYRGLFCQLSGHQFARNESPGTNRSDKKDCGLSRRPVDAVLEDLNETSVPFQLGSLHQVLPIQNEAFRQRLLPRPVPVLRISHSGCQGKELCHRPNRTSTRDWMICAANQHRRVERSKRGMRGSYRALAVRPEGGFCTLMLDLKHRANPEAEILSAARDERGYSVAAGRHRNRSCCDRDHPSNKPQ